MGINKFCPFIKDECKEDCVFKHRKVAMDNEIYECLIAIQLLGINDYQYDQLVEIVNNLDSKS